MRLLIMLLFAVSLTACEKTREDAAKVIERAAMEYHSGLETRTPPVLLMKDGLFSDNQKLAIFFEFVDNIGQCQKVARLYQAEAVAENAGNLVRYYCREVR